MQCITVVMHVLASIEIALAGPPYEDDPQYYKHQRVADIVSIPQVLLVKRQTAGNVLLPNTRCQAMRRIRRIAENSYLYQVFHSNPDRENQMISFTTTLTTSLTALHRHANVMAYQTVLGGPVTEFKVMFADARNGCFVLVTKTNELQKGCRILQTPLTVTKPVPMSCLQVYFENCPPESVEIYDIFCRSMIRPLLRAGIRRWPVK
uniref:Putative licpodalin-4 1 n=1 Tax=Amblyomma triste TaxID=251400 RepID=A0A023GE22_AMBTT